AAADLAAEDLFLAGKYDEAAAAYEKLSATAKGDEKLRVAFRLSQCAYFRGDFAKTISLATPLAGDPKVAADENLRRAIFLLGDAQLQTGLNDQAARTLGRYLPLAGGDRPEVQYKLALAQLRAGMTQQAQQNFQAVFQKDSSSQWALKAMFQSAQLAYRQKRTDKARELVNRLISAKLPEELAAPSLYLAAWLDFDAKHYDRAASRFAELARRFPRHELAEEFAYRRGVCLAEGGDYQQARAALEEYLKAHPTGKFVAQAKHYLGRCLAKLGKPSAAATVLASVAEDAKAVTPDVLYELAWARRGTKDMPAAEKAYRRIIEKFPDDRLATSARAELAELLYARKDYRQAASLLERVVADKSAEKRTLTIARYRLGFCYRKLDETDKAAETFSALASAGADEFTPSAMYEAAAAYTELGKLNEAEKQLASLVAKYPKDDLTRAAMLKLGQVQSQAHEYDAAERTFQAFLRKYPKDEFAFMARFGIGWSLENRGRYDEARKYYRQVIASRNDPTAARAQFQVGECYFAEKKYDKAAAELLKVDIVYAYPEWSARAVYEAARAFEAAGQADEARRQYETCARKYPKTIPGRQAAKRLEEMKK
ncbi:MAG: tetratricopeptide repeat protein, partial [Planctomycetes bacterium]|nr:tetratricopeptide repeat protein [Planctomycetota bacterium]